MDQRRFEACRGNQKMKKKEEKCLTDKCRNFRCKKMVSYSDLRRWENMGIPNDELPMKDLTENCKDIIHKE